MKYGGYCGNADVAGNGEGLSPYRTREAENRLPAGSGLPADTYVHTDFTGAVGFKVGIFLVIPGINIR